MITQGATRVICAATVSATLPEFRRGTGGGWITAEYAMLPRSTAQRAPRGQMLTNKRSVEISRFLGRCLRAVVDLDALGPWLIQIDCDVIDADGGTRCAALNGGFVALRDAVNVVMRRQNRDLDPVKDVVAGVSVARVDGLLVVDPCYEEDRRASIDLTMAATGTGRIVEIHAASEAEPYDRSTLDSLISMAADATQTVYAAQRACWPCD